MAAGPCGAVYRIADHRAGIAAVRRVVERALDLEIARLTLYAFSSDNWRRPASEVQGILWLLRAFLRSEAEKLRQRGVRFQAIGRRDRLAESVMKEIQKTESMTASGSRLRLCVAIDYSVRESIARAAADATALFPDKQLRSPDLIGSALAQALTVTGGDVDLLIRTGGEKRLSDFLLWESAYAELLFMDRMWPDFGKTDLDLALEEFHRRERRFGGTPTTETKPVISTV